MKNALVTITVAFLFCSTLMAQDNAARLTLKGITGVKVIIEALDPDAKGLSEEQIQTDVELRLRMAGIKVYEELKGAGGVVLDVQLTTHKCAGVLFSSVRVFLAQPVRLERDLQHTLAETWSKNKVGTVESLDRIRDAVKDSVDEFIEKLGGGAAMLILDGQKPERVHNPIIPEQEPEVASQLRPVHRFNYSKVHTTPAPKPPKIR